MHLQIVSLAYVQLIHAECQKVNFAMLLPFSNDDNSPENNFTVSMSALRGHFELPPWCCFIDAWFRCGCHIKWYKHEFVAQQGIQIMNDKCIAVMCAQMLAVQPQIHTKERTTAGHLFLIMQGWVLFKLRLTIKNQ